MISFFPGPSQVHPETGTYLQDAFNEGILSISHRSETFNQLSRQTLELLRNRLGIPEEYSVLYTSSATECWEIIAQSLTEKQSVHFSSGSFGDKWYQYAHNLHPASRFIPCALNEELYSDYLDVSEADEIICLTQNETSNGTQVRPEVISSIRGAFPDKLIALDCTSSLAGIPLPFVLGDIWFASVQKCFGLPAGLGLMILSPAAVERARALNDKKYYNSLLTMLGHIENFQTSCTPNVLGIYLLKRVMENAPFIEETGSVLQKRMEQYNALFRKGPLRPLVVNEKVQSTTVLAVAGDPEYIAGIKAEAKAEGMLLGSGYGKWKPDTFRIANFPAFTDEQVRKLVQFFQNRL